MNINIILYNFFIYVNKNIYIRKQFDSKSLLNSKVDLLKKKKKIKSILKCNVIEEEKKYTKKKKNYIDICKNKIRHKQDRYCMFKTDRNIV